MTIIKNNYNFHKTSRDIVELKINSELRSTLHIDLEKLMYLVNEKQDIQPLVEDIEEVIDACVLDLTNKINEKVKLPFLANKLKESKGNEMFYDIIQKFEGIEHNQPMENIYDTTDDILDFYREKQKNEALKFNDFLTLYKLKNGEIIKIDTSN
jgi:hypothetical protein